jgi:hypothetical protein
MPYIAREREVGLSAMAKHMGYGAGPFGPKNHEARNNMDNLEINPTDGGTETAVAPVQRFEQIFHQDFRHCDCAMPMLLKKWNDALGTFVAIRLCCLARAVEKLTGQKLYEVYDFAPKWEWDCARVEPCAAADGSDALEYRMKGPPPRWLGERLKKKGLPIYNEPSE